jgi:hypothetical protein
MSKAKNSELRVVVFKDGDMYVAQCLEHDICAQAADIKSLRSRIDAAIDAERDHARRLGKALSDTVDSAPKHYFEMWEKSWGAHQDAGDMRLALCA